LFDLSPMTENLARSAGLGVTRSGLDRRAALKLFAGGAALALASCGKPAEEIVPYVEIPEGLTPGIPLKFATALPLAGYARGVLVKSVEGRPTKIEGNPRHPASLGSTDVFAEAGVLSLYDPDRSQAVRNRAQPVAWETFAGVLRTQMEQESSRRGSGLRLLSGRITSPTLRRQLDDLLRAFPEARWHRYEPVNDDAALAGALQAFGRPVVALPRLNDTKVMLALDADPIGPGPQQIRMGRDFVGARRAQASPEDFLRLYVAEPAWTLTGANADHRLVLAPQLIRNLALAVAKELGASVDAGLLPPPAQRFAQLAVGDLKSRPGRAVVMTGRAQPPEVHALCHWINAQLKAPVDLIDPVDVAEPGHADSLRTLNEDIVAKRVQTLIILDANPAYDAPGDLDVHGALGSVPFSVHCGHYSDETAAICAWHLPLAHPLESWSDLRSLDGTASIVQPLIYPLYDTRTLHQLLAYMGGAASASSYDLVRETWKARGASGDFETWWRGILTDGVIPSTAQQPAQVPTPKLPVLAPAHPPAGFTLTLAPDPLMFDGTFSNNAWLQECPQPVTRQVWGNAAHLSANDARRLGLVDGDVVRLGRGDFQVDAPVMIRPGQADGIISTTLGYGRWQAGAIGNEVGFNAHRLQSIGSAWVLEGVSMAATRRREEILTTQHQYQLEGEARELLPVLSIAELKSEISRHHASSAEPATLYPAYPYNTYAWSMVIDTAACIGCNACVIACQAENNVPIVGPQEIGMGRDMHWLRIDTYFASPSSSPGFQPVPCMHCEQAPCEPVCPVMASIHDAEGLNVQVYNRCVGTRFCQSNCPYKVRRFNFFGYASGQEYANLGADVVKLQFNPDVTVRARGVMEKCTYCVQRISQARRTAERENRKIHEGEVTTACQDACPTRAISFGDRNDPAAGVNTLRQERRHYELLGELGTRPRTSYLARLRNPNPALTEENA
jgi:Fe-S-cluster-containing dehydrogenase component/anaerobic selenocysteine-containing dehydrogenase